MATETTERQGYFTGWTLKREGIIAPEERLPWGQTIFVGLQHVLAMFGATVLAPIIMGFNPNTAIFFSGIGTLIFFLIVGGRVPSYLGSSFSFIAVVLVAEGATHNIPVALGGIIAAGVVYAIIGLIVMFTGYKWIEYLMPPAVTGVVVAVIGLNLAPVAISEATHSTFDTWMALVTVLAVALVAVYFPGPLRRLPILLGGVIGYLIYLLLANGFGVGGPGAVIKFTALNNAAWFGPPVFTTPVFQASAMILIAPVAIILVAENLGHVKAENIGVMAVTRIYSTLIFIIAAVVAILLGFSPKFGALIATIPLGVLGGLAIVLFGLIAATGGRIWVQNQVDFSKSRNLITAAVALTMGAGNFTLTIRNFTMGGIATATFSAIILYQVLREREPKPEEISTADSAVEAGE